MQARPPTRTVQRRAAEMAADMVDVGKIAQARAFKIFFSVEPCSRLKYFIEPHPCFRVWQCIKLLNSSCL